MWVNTNISGMLWPSNATFQAVSHLSKISTWVAAEKHNAPYPRVNPSFVEVNDKTVFDFSGVRTGKVWLPFELRVGDILQENESDFHSTDVQIFHLYTQRELTLFGTEMSL